MKALLVLSVLWLFSSLASCGTAPQERKEARIPDTSSLRSGEMHVLGAY